MYNIKGPSKIVAKTTRRGISQNIDSFRDHPSKNTKSLDANENEVANGPKPVFYNNSKRTISNTPKQSERITPQHQEIVKYIQDSWLSVNSEILDDNSQSNSNRNFCNGNHCKLYYEDDPSPHLQDFKAFDLESWWGKRLYNFITNSVGAKN